MSKSIDQDITATLEKLKLLLQYSTSNRSDEALQFIERACTIWNAEEEEAFNEETID